MRVQNIKLVQNVDYENKSGGFHCDTWITNMSKLLMPSMSSLGLTLVTSCGFKNLGKV